MWSATLNPVIKKTASAPKFNWPAVFRLWLPLLVLVVLAVVVTRPPACTANYRLDKQLIVNGHYLNAELASNYAEQTQGLSGRACLGSSQAMLFQFNQPGYYPFWMKNMRFAIDIVWLDQAKQVVDIAPSVSPRTYPHTFSNSQPAQYVVEMAAGQAQKLGIGTGSNINF